MFAYIHGTLNSKLYDSVIVETGGVGYLIHTALSTLSVLPTVGTEVKLFTRFIVREDSHTLYGFATREELGMFETLLAVSGVGPKAALALLSAVTPSQFSLAVLTDDYKLLTRANGVGGKLAQKIVFELRDKIRKEMAKAGYDVSTGIITGVDADGKSVFAGDGKASGTHGGEVLTRGKFGESVEALLVLGYSALEANRAVTAVYSDELSIEVIIRRSLTELS